MRDDLEFVQIDQVIERLITRFPAESPAEIELLVRRIHARFAEARIRDFVPLLVEKAARQAVGRVPVEIPRSTPSMATIQ
ncbi:three-helix bundle dimerization domain-containing protein [Nocardia sp. NPDC087230]|uniref:three-helix bundle dimerization domain-containing protein n=1 Tax=Nocardia sp. NPDC087230 TaxID=3364331 RepID=UPI0038022810